jgi:thioredoxin 1
MISEPVHVTDAAFEKTVLQSPIPVIIDFWATWCNPCKAIAPVMDKIAAEYAGKLIVAKLDIDSNPETTMKYGVQSIPTLLFIAKGKVLNRQVGSAPEANIRMAVEQFLQVAG